jgi:hypothetical protein
MSPKCILALVAATVALGAAAGAPGTLSAAVPDQVIRGWQNSATEALEVTVLSVTQITETRPSQRGSITTIKVTLTAKVDAVHRSASGLTAGETIAIRYTVTREEPPVPGPQSEAILTKGDRAAAYLKSTGSTNFILAGAVGSLERR